MKPKSEVLSPAECCGGERTRAAAGSGLGADSVVTKCAHKEGCNAEAPVAAAVKKQEVGASSTRFPREV